MRLVNWRFWGLLAALTAAYVGTGYAYDTVGPVVEWLYRVAIVGVPTSAALFIVIYTILGLRGPVKWWRTDFGNRLVMFPMAMIVSTCVLAWAELFHGGLLNTPLSAWIYTGGMLAAMLILLWGSYLWLRAARNDKDDAR